MQKTHTRHVGDKWRCRVAGQYTSRLNRPTAGPRRLYAVHGVAVLDRERENTAECINTICQAISTAVLANYNVICPSEERRRLKNAPRYRRAVILELENAGWRHFET